jgi:cellulose synthase/poly-beta-1,6-N-acetylglucosamine synthase-like glycosyltransferase
MMIPILMDYYAPGYLLDAGSKTIPPYLPNVNLAFRRQMFDDIGGYDELCDAGEDADLCIRAARAGWAQFFNPGARASHEPRRTLGALLRQWIWYGRGGSHFFFKQQRYRLEIYLHPGLTPKMHQYRRMLALSWFPVPAMIFISRFLLTHLFAFAGLIAAVAGFPMIALPAFALVVLLSVSGYRTSTLKRLSWKELMLYLGIAYLINWTCIFSSCIAGLKKRRIFLYPGI